MEKESFWSLGEPRGLPDQAGLTDLFHSRSGLQQSSSTLAQSSGVVTPTIKRFRTYLTVILLVMDHNISKYLCFLIGDPCDKVI